MRYINRIFTYLLTKYENVQIPWSDMPVPRIADFIAPSGQTGRWRHCVLDLTFVRSFVCLLPNSEHDILKMTEPILMSVGKDMKW